MRRLMTWAVAAVAPALLVSTLTIGCTGDNKSSEAPPVAKDNTGKKAGDKGGKGKKEELASTGWTTVKGRITLDGKVDTAPLNDELHKAMEANKQDGKFCLSAPDGQKDEQSWVLGKDNGLANVFVWLAPPEGKVFKIDWDKKPWAKEVVIDQPHCAFVPHTAVYFPGVPEGKGDELKSSGQKFIIKNDAPILHNTNWKGGDANPGDNKPIPSKGQIEPELKPDTEPVVLKCNVHPWMSGFVRVFDHPYAAVTDKDGNFKIENVPAGAELHVVVWHESGTYGTKSGKGGSKATLKAGEDNEFNDSIKK
jgi:hypothetical protein